MRKAHLNLIPLRTNLSLECLVNLLGRMECHKKSYAGIIWPMRNMPARFTLSLMALHRKLPYLKIKPKAPIQNLPL
jgi:hypothetical protein